MFLVTSILSLATFRLKKKQKLLPELTPIKNLENNIQYL